MQEVHHKKALHDPHYKIIFSLSIILAIVAGFYFGRLSLERPDLIPSLEPTGVNCTMEALLCPDGSAVGRVGPNCEFAPCQGE